jgi:3-hydroxyacyl-CoA dehydrogenase
VHVTKQFVGAYGDRCYLSTLIPQMVKEGTLGEKSGSGFYSYENKKKKAKAQPDAIADFVVQAAKDAGSPESLRLSDQVGSITLASNNHYLPCLCFQTLTQTCFLSSLLTLPGHRGDGALPRRQRVRAPRR